MPTALGAMAADDPPLATAAPLAGLAPETAFGVAGVAAASDEAPLDADAQ